MTNKADIGFIFLTVIITFLGGIAIHEYTHLYFFERAGCDSELRILSQGHQETGPAIASVHSSCNGTEKELNKLKERQAVVEAVGYQVIPLYMFIGILLALQFQRQVKSG